jgi:hypothetical protein
MSDAAVCANLCACGCGQQIPARGPSPDFVNEKHQRVWAERNSGQPSAWIAAARAQIEARDSIPATLPHDPDETPMARVVRETSSLRRAIDKILGKSR